MKQLLSLSFLAAALLLAGCGGSNEEGQDEQTGVEAAAIAWAEAFGADRIDEMCERTTDPGNSSDPASCKSIFAGGSPFGRSFSHPAVERSDYAGNNAILEFDQGDVIELERVKGAWLVSNFGGEIPYRLPGKPESALTPASREPEDAGPNALMRARADIVSACATADFLGEALDGQRRMEVRRSLQVLTAGADFNSEATSSEGDTIAEILYDLTPVLEDCDPGLATEAQAAVDDL